MRQPRKNLGKLAQTKTALNDDIKDRDIRSDARRIIRFLEQELMDRRIGGGQ